ncbi:MAG: NAD(P)/FAD-dependent oxidoreductase [Thermodesulfovibrionales bacterium]|nr:NAD(P)/FAD-dependent oxidoreductase [Thermodesulfovibrionales bacterium]
MVKLSSDVIVIGGGPAGSIAARTLAEYGLDTVLVERNLKHIKPCGGGIPSTAFKEFLIPLDIVKKEVDHVEIIPPSQKRLSVTLKGGAISIVDRAEFDSLLREKASLKGARIIEAEFIRFLEISPIIKSLLKKGEEAIELSSKYAIIADGVNSRARNSLGLRPVNAVFTLSIKFNEINTERCEFWFGSEHAPGFYSWVFPLSAGTGSHESGSIKGNFSLFLKKRNLSLNVPLRGYRIPLWSLRGSILEYGPSILLAGDAAGLVLPLTFEGIYYAMASAKLAAEAIIENRPSIYKKEWKERYLRSFSFMKLLWRYFLRNDRLVEKLVDLHRLPEAQEIAIELWLKKSLDKKSLHSYIRLFRKLIGIKI